MSFLHGKELQEEIKKCLSSKSAKRCAVAYIGRGAFDIINGKCEILCDLFSSGTNPKEVKRLFNKKNVTIRHQKDLHAKIYSTENFVILGSANMTNHALNFDGSDNTLIEACSKFEKKKLPKNYSAAREFVDSLWNDGVVVTEKLIDNAIEEYESGERENIPSRLNITDFCDGSNYICLYTDANLSKEGGKTANQELGANWSCKDYTVFGKTGKNCHVAISLTCIGIRNQEKLNIVGSPNMMELEFRLNMKTMKTKKEFFIFRIP